MAKQCTVCNRSYPSRARFCALCGRPLVAEASPHGPRHGRLVLAVVLSAVVTYAVVAASRSPDQLEKRFFNLPDEKAAALFNMLKPADVKVIVGRDGGNVSISGTAGECDALAEFAGLIARLRGQPSCAVKEHIEHARKTWTTSNTYRLPRSKAETLFNALAPDDVPVLVSRDGKRVRVEANPHDQATIRHVVQILRGRRL